MPISYDCEITPMIKEVNLEENCPENKQCLPVNICLDQTSYIEEKLSSENEKSIKFEDSLTCDWFIDSMCKEMYAIVSNSINIAEEMAHNMHQRVEHFYPCENLDLKNFSTSLHRLDELWTVWLKLKSGISEKLTSFNDKIKLFFDVFQENLKYESPLPHLEEILKSKKYKEITSQFRKQVTESFIDDIGEMRIRIYQINKFHIELSSKFNPTKLELFDNFFSAICVKDEKSLRSSSEFSYPSEHFLRRMNKNEKDKLSSDLEILCQDFFENIAIHLMKIEIWIETVTFEVGFLIR